MLIPPRFYVYGAILAALMAFSGAAVWWVRNDARKDAEAAQKAADEKQYRKERRAIDNADTSKGDADADRDWLRGAADRLSGPR
jgi:hypothetical protein